MNNKNKIMQNKNMKTIVLTGGGTAGHVMPNLALIPELKNHFDRIVYIGTNRIEKDLVQNENIEFFEISAPKLIRSLSFENLKIPVKLFKSISEAKLLLKEIKPNVIFSKGGFVSVPVAIAGKQLKIPVLTHESDLSLGLANKIISLFSTATLTSFEKTAENKRKFIYCGCPIREQILKGKPNKSLFNFSQNKKTILFFGGSLGAKTINNLVDSNFELLTRKYNVLHICGKGKQNKIKAKNYVCVQYTNQIENFLATADFIVCRAGANSVFEIMALNKPAILIPLSKAQSRGDQIENARYFGEKGMCKVLFEEELTDEKFLELLKELEKNEKIIKDNIKNNKIENPNKKIVEIIIENAK